MSVTDYSRKNIKEFLNNKYWIPDYQREYAWSENELEDLWTDLIELVNNKKIQMHFFGQIVVHRNLDEEKNYIIDGQQRITTSIILLSVLRDEFYNLYKENNYEDANYEVEDITSLFIGRITSTRKELNFFLGNNDRIFFESAIQYKKIQRRQIPKKISNSQSKILKAYEYFEKKINNESYKLSSTEKKYEKLKNIYKTFIEKFILICVNTDDINEAFIIFETLNARGKDLETADLLKNHLFRISETKIQNVKDNWQKMNDNLGKIDATSFIRHYWNSQYTFIREKDLYKKIRKQINSPKKAEDLMNELYILSEVYSSLASPIEENYFGDKNISKILEILKELSTTTFYPIILAMTKLKFQNTDIFKVLKMLETLAVRNFVVAKRVANIFEIRLAEIAYNISQEKLTIVDEILSEIKNLIISDDEFQQSFSSFEIKKKPVIRYILRKLNDFYSKEIQVKNDNNQIHIEHIMPQQIKYDLWNISKEEHDEYLWKLGNLTLLGEEYNKNALNKKFINKKEVYKKSEIEITKTLTEYNDWNIEEIKKRQNKFSKIAINIWNII